MKVKELIHLIPVLEIMTSISFDIVQLFDYDEVKEDIKKEDLIKSIFFHFYYTVKNNLLCDLREAKIQLTKNKQYNIV